MDEPSGKTFLSVVARGPWADPGPSSCAPPGHPRLPPAGTAAGGPCAAQRHIQRGPGASSLPTGPAPFDRRGRNIASWQPTANCSCAGLLRTVRRPVLLRPHRSMSPRRGAGMPGSRLALTCG